MANGSRNFIGRFRLVNRTSDKHITRVGVTVEGQSAQDEPVTPPLPPGSALEIDAGPPTAPVGQVRVEVEAATLAGPRVYVATKDVVPPQPILIAEAELLEAQVMPPALPGSSIAWLALHVWTATGERRSVTARVDGPPQWA